MHALWKAGAMGLLAAGWLAVALPGCKDKDDADRDVARSGDSKPVDVVGTDLEVTVPPDVVGTDLGRSCAEDVDCFDCNVCTLDTCVDGQCTFVPNLERLGCCNADEQCDDQKACTSDQCVNWTCVHNDIPACCVPDGQATTCDDGDPCTCDLCMFGKCRNLPPDSAPEDVCEFQEQCCADCGACDDSDEATHDVCVAGHCLHFADDEAPGDLLGPGGQCCDEDGACSDGNLCTVDLCGSDGGCSHVAAVDGALCGTEEQLVCQGGQCVLESSCSPQ